MAQSLYTLADLKAIVYAEVENNQVFFRPAEVTAVINECLKVINLFTGFYQGAVETLSVAGQLIYEMPAGIVYPLRAQFNNTTLDPIAINQIGKDFRDWATSTTNKDGPVARWVPIGTNYFCLNPMDSLGGQSIYITGVLEPPLLVNDTDEMVLDDEYVTLISGYCGHRLVLKEGGAVFSQASLLYQDFQRAMKNLTALRKVIMPRYFVQQAAPVMEGNTR